MRALNGLLQRVAATIECHGMFRAGQTVGVAVSGGADSVCLLHVLRELAPRWQLRLAVLHLDHGLRGDESRADAEFVTGLAETLGLPAIVRRAQMEPGANLEEAGRNARLAFFREVMTEGTVDRVALGHTRRDQAETVLFRILRGAGSAGLAGVRPVTDEGLVRPLLEIGREEVAEYLASRGIAWREDSTNAGNRFARNRIRHALLPQLAREWNPRIEETLAHMAEWARAEEAYWEDELDRRCLLAPEPHTGAVVLGITELRSLPLAVARRVVRRAMERAKGDLRGIDFRHVEAVLALAGRTSGSGGLQAPGIAVRRSFEWIRVAAQPEPSVAPYAFAVNPPAALQLPGSGPVVCLELLEKPQASSVSDYVWDYVYNGGMGCLDWGRVGRFAQLRNWRPGDWVEPTAGAGPEKIKTLFQLARVPFWERAQWPVLADGARVLWTRRFGVAAAAAADASSRMILRVRETDRAGSAPNSES